jgi:predicted nucleotidyltransferase
LLTHLERAVRDFYGPRLVSVVVYGSVARGRPHAESDVDFLIVAEPLPKGRMPRMDEFQSVKRVLAPQLDTLTNQGIFTALAPVFKTPAEVNLGSLLFLDMIDDGRILYDPSGFWKRFMIDFQRRLRRLGARKIVEGDHWYWDLKPDYRVGETFEI